MPCWTRICCVSFLSFALSAPCSAKDAEEMFAEANDYTVRIDVTISTPFFEDRKGAAHGAGFLVDRKRRWVMTNAHVAGRSPSMLEVIAADGSRVGAEKVYVDPYIDLAIIQLDEDIPALKEAALGCKQDPGTGHPVGAYGHPWGLNFTGTQGVISGSTEKWGPTHLQTDTPINGGNSGGPLISLKTGRVVGINTSSIRNNDDQNTNFAVPISQTCRILSLLRDGVDPSPPELAFDFYDTVEDDNELTVARTFLSSEDIGLKEGDEILAVENQEVSNVSELVHWLRGTLDDVNLKIRRDDEIVKLHGQLPPESSIVDRQGIYFSGVTFAVAPYHDSRVWDIGVMVHGIERGSEGNGADIDSYDFVVRVDGSPVHDLAQLRQMLASDDRSSEKVQIDLMRISFSESSGRLFHLVRRNLKWTPPVDIGTWPDTSTASQLDQ